MFLLLAIVTFGSLFGAIPPVSANTGFPLVTWTTLSFQSSYTVKTSDQGIWVDTSATAVEIDLPNSASCVGCSFLIADGACNSGVNNINLTPFGSDNVMGGGAGVQWPLNVNCGCVRIVSDGVGNWFGLIGV
jgi:hypothetical protein